MAKHFVRIPKDLAQIRQKFIFGLTKRQLICFGIGAAIGFPAFYIFNALLGLQVGCLALGISAGPAIFCGIFKKNGMYLEKYAKLMFIFIRKPKKRTYQSENALLIVSRQLEYNRLHRLLNESYASEKTTRR